MGHETRPMDDCLFTIKLCIFIWPIVSWPIDILASSVILFIYLFIFETLETSVPPQTMHTHSDFSISMWILQKQICSLPDWLILNAMYLIRILIWRPHAWGLRVRTLDTFRYTRVSWLSTCQKKKPRTATLLYTIVLRFQKKKSFSKNILSIFPLLYWYIFC